MSLRPCEYCGAPIPPPPSWARGCPKRHCSLTCTRKHAKEREGQRVSARIQADRAKERPCAKGCGRTVVPSFSAVGARPTVCGACCEARQTEKRNRRRAREKLPTTPLTPAQELVRAAIEAGAAKLADITKRTGLAPMSVATYAALLARRGIVARPEPGVYARAS